MLQHIDFNRKIGQSSMSDKRLRELIMHLNKVPLRQKDFELPDLLGAAYEYLIRDFADRRQEGGKFYTPRDLVRLMVQIADPLPGMSVYDPCTGSGGMLILSKEYVEESGGDGRNLALAGQEKDRGVVGMAVGLIGLGVLVTQTHNRTECVGTLVGVVVAHRRSLVRRTCCCFERGSQLTPAQCLDAAPSTQSRAAGRFVRCSQDRRRDGSPGKGLTERRGAGPG